MGTGLIYNVIKEIFESNFILDKIAVKMSGLTLDESLKLYEKKLNINQPIIINSIYLDFI